MPIEMQVPGAETLDEAVDALSGWQHPAAPIQLHPGDLGWRWRFGAEALADCLRVWRGDGDIVAMGFVDGSALIRMAIAPSADAAEDLARRLISDLSDPARGVLPAGEAVVEARFGAAFRTLLREQGWVDDEPWTPLHRDLAAPVNDCGLRIQVVGPEHVQDRLAVQRAAFGGSTFTVERWQMMAAGSPYRRGRCLVGYTDQDVPVAAVTVWSAGEGRPGLLEPMGVHPEHRGHGYGTAITTAAAAALQNMGSSSAVVVAESSNTGAVATYAAAGFRAFPEVTDFRRQP